MRKLTLQQAARRMLVHPQTIRLWMRRGIIPDRRLPGTRKLWFYPDDLDRPFTSELDKAA